METIRTGGGGMGEIGGLGGVGVMHIMRALGRHDDYAPGRRVSVLYRVRRAGRHDYPLLPGPWISCSRRTTSWATSAMALRISMSAV